jgi:acetyl-CoA C-acetyltransferase
MNNTHQAYSGGRPVYICDGSRTPFLKAQGRPGPFRPRTWP